MSRILVLICIVLASGMVSAQSIKGKLADPADNKPLAGATLVLTSVKDSLSIHNTVSDNTGGFRFQGILPDTFSLRVSFIGYEEYKQVVAVSDSVPDVDLKTVFVPKTTVQLG